MLRPTCPLFYLLPPSKRKPPQRKTRINETKKRRRRWREISLAVQDQGCGGFRLPTGAIRSRGRGGRGRGGGGGGPGAGHRGGRAVRRLRRQSLHGKKKSLAIIPELEGLCTRRLGRRIFYRARQARRQFRPLQSLSDSRSIHVLVNKASCVHTPNKNQSTLTEIDHGWRILFRGVVLFFSSKKRRREVK